MLRLAETAHAVLTDDGGVFLDERTGRWTQMTPTASAAVQLLLATDSPQEAAQRYAERYRIPPERAWADVTEVANRLAARGLTAGEEIPRRRFLGRR